jgi:hypothetical protein
MVRLHAGSIHSTNDSRACGSARAYSRRQLLANGATAPLRPSQIDHVCAITLRAVDHDPVLVRNRRFFLPHSSYSSRFTAGATAFFILSQSGKRPER